MTTDSTVDEAHGGTAALFRVAAGIGTEPEAWTQALDASAIDIAALPQWLAGDPAARCVAFYRSPWEAFLQACRTLDAGGDDRRRAGNDTLEKWAAEATTLVDAASRWPDRVMLVNAGRLDARAQALADELVAEGWCTTASAPVLDDAAPGGDARLLARLFEDYAPERWDAYEELEARARLLGREAEFRDGGAGLEDPAAEALAIWGDAVSARRDAAHPRVRREELDMALDRLRELQDLHAESDARRIAAETTAQALELRHAQQAALAQELACENELLLEHVAQLRQELADQARGADQLRETIVRLTNAANQARMLFSK